MQGFRAAILECFHDPIDEIAKEFGRGLRFIDWGGGGGL